MKTVPLRGKKAAGRVALVDDGDYDLVMQHQWHVLEPAPKPGKQPKTPYAAACIKKGGRPSSILMHKLITGWPLTDHEDRNGLNNQRWNLRRATRGQNNQNSVGRAVRSSQYKGLCWIPDRGLWRANISHDGRQRLLGNFVSEVEAAYAYDAAAREAFGEFARTNFPEGPAQELCDQWEAARSDRQALGAANHLQSRTSAGWWEQREAAAYTCVRCGEEYQSRTVGPSLYCGYRCRKAAGRAAEAERKRKKRAREREKRQAEGAPL